MPWPVEAIEDDGEVAPVGDEGVVKVRQSPTTAVISSQPASERTKRPYFQNFVDAVSSCVYPAITAMSNMACGKCDASKHECRAVSTFAYAV